MLAGPPRIVSLATILAFLGLAWWYLRVAHSPASSLPGLRVGSTGGPSQSPAFQNPLDFSIPLRFSDGVAKAPGSNYSHIMVVPKTQKEDLEWMKNELPDTPLAIYEVDNPNAERKIPKNKGREAMVYLSYIIDNYHNLPDIVIFMHAHRHAWHNNMLMGLDTVQMIRRLNFDRVARMGYMNIRCHHEPGCPDWIHMDRPGGDFDFFHKPEEIYWRRNIWEEIHPGAPIPPSLSGICCAQFAVSRERILQVPLARFQHYRKWLLHTNMEDQWSGRIFEYIWHYIFTGHEVYCPAMNTCYCDGYGFCFGGQKNFANYFDKQDRRNKKNEELNVFLNAEEKAKEEGRTIQWNVTQKATMAELRRTILQWDIEMEQERSMATERGKDPKLRAEETENYDSTHIWDYAPKSE